MDTIANKTTSLKAAREVPNTRYGAVLMAIYDELDSLETSYKELNNRTAPIQEQPTPSAHDEQRDRTGGETRLEDELLVTLDRVRTISQMYYDLLQRIQP